MVAVPDVPRMSVEQYLETDRFSNVRHEFVDGYVYAMSGGTQDHSIIGANLVTLLRTAVRGGPCRAYTSDIRAQLTSAAYVYPDASISCDPGDRRGAADVINFPRLAVEVLSDATRAYDRSGKFVLYQQNPAMEEYVLVETRRREVEVRRRQVDGRWVAQVYRDGDDVRLDSVAAVVPIAVIYEDSDV